MEATRQGHYFMLEELLGKKRAMFLLIILF